MALPKRLNFLPSWVTNAKPAPFSRTLEAIAEVTKDAGDGEWRAENMCDHVGPA